MSILGDTWRLLEQPAGQLFPLMQYFLDIALKGSVLLSLAALVCFCLPRSSAAFRHFIWTAATIGFLFCPIFSFLLPPLDLAILPPQAHATQIELENNSSQGVLVAISSPGVNGMFLVTIVWFMGVLVYFLCWGIGLARTRRLQQKAARLGDMQLANLVCDACEEVQLKRVPQVLITKESIMPMTLGILKSVVLLPASCVQWSYERTRVVLLHELSHVHRLDSLIQALFQLLFALHWYNPLLWYANRQMRLLREEACDDRVIGCGVSPVDYSTHLVNMVREYRLLPASQLAGAMMARASQLETRVRDLLAFVRNRETVSSLKVLTVCALMFLIAGPLAVIRPIARESHAHNGSDMVQGPIIGSEEIGLDHSAVMTSNQANAPLVTATRRRIVIPQNLFPFSLDDLKLEKILSTGETTIAQIVRKDRNQTYFLSSGQSQDGIQVETVDQADNSVTLIRGTQRFRLQLVDEQFDPLKDSDTPEVKTSAPMRRRILGA